jgi:hypothetical protein
MLYTVIPHERIYGETEYDRIVQNQETGKVEIQDNPIACGKIELTALSQVEINSLQNCLEIELNKG